MREEAEDMVVYTGGSLSISRYICRMSLTCLFISHRTGLQIYKLIRFRGALVRALDRRRLQDDPVLLPLVSRDRPHGVQLTKVEDHAVLRHVSDVIQGFSRKSATQPPF